MYFKLSCFFFPLVLLLFSCNNPLIPSPPTSPIITASNGDYADKIFIQWNAVSNAISYNVYRSDSCEGEFKNISGNTRETEFNDDSVIPGTIYHYKVMAVGFGGESELGNCDDGYAETEPFSVVTAHAEESYYSSVISESGFENTHESDNYFEVIEESDTDGMMIHSWEFFIPDGSDVSYFYILAHCDKNDEHDNFSFEYKSGEDNYTEMFVVSKNMDQRTYQYYKLPDEITGSVTIRTVDTNWYDDASTKQKLYIDHMYIKVTSKKQSRLIKEDEQPHPQNWIFYTGNRSGYPQDYCTWAYEKPFLKWVSGENAKAHDVYLGDDYASVAHALNEPSSEVFKCRTNESVYAVPDRLSPNKWYYWRVDEISPNEIIKGDTWAFYVPGLTSSLPERIDPRIGGGFGYGNVTEYDNMDPDQILVGNAQELVEMLSEKNEKGEYVNKHKTIYIADFDMQGNLVDIELDLSGEKNIPLPEGVTLAGARGTNAYQKGSLITKHFDEITNSSPLFLTMGPDVRITGLRFGGNDPSDILPVDSLGIRAIISKDTVEIDNCEFFNWSYAAIELRTSADKELRIHHNYFHDNWGIADIDGVDVTDTLGYGVEVGEGIAIIEANIFDRCRHAIAGIETEETSYDAGYNIVLSSFSWETPTTLFDMHGAHDYPPYPKYSTAGKWIKIHHNTFAWVHSDGSMSTGSPYNKPIVGIRGIPRESCEVYENLFFDTDINHAVRQWNTMGNMTVEDNYLGIFQESQEENDWIWDVTYWPESG